MKIYIEVHCLPLYNFPREDNPDARAAWAKLLLDRHAYLFQNPEGRLFMLPFRILIEIMASMIWWLSPHGDLWFHHSRMFVSIHTPQYVDL